MKELIYSEIIYLFADKAVSERSRFLNKDEHPSGQKISAKPLSHKMVILALAYLFEKKYIELSIKNIKKLFVFPGKAVFGKQIKEAGPEIAGIEKKLLENFKKETDVEKAVYYILDDDETSPWGQVINISKNSLVEKEFLMMEKGRQNIFSAKKYLHGAKKREEVLSLYEETEKTLKKFSEKKDIYKLIENAVKNGIGARQERSSSDD